MLGLVVVIVVMALFYLLLGRGSSTPAAKPTAGPARVAVAGTGKKPAVHRPPVKKAVVQSKKAPAARPLAAAQPAAHVKVAPAVADQRIYAARLVPIVDKGVHGFDTAVGAAASSSGMSGLAGSCAQSLRHLGILQDQVEGVPHPYVWYSPAGGMHRSLLGIYHDMVGAADSCQTTAGNGDDAGARMAVHDMAAAARQLHRTDSYLHWLARQSK